jgi:hypothetical protein
MNIHPDAVGVGFTTGSYCWLGFIHLCLSASVSFRHRSRYSLPYRVCGLAGSMTGDFELTNIYIHSACPVADLTADAGQQGIHSTDSIEPGPWKANRSQTSQENRHTLW